MEPVTKSERVLIRPPQGIPRALVTEYLECCRAGLPLLRVAAGQSQHDQARILGHRMKGTGAPYGFAKLTEIGARIERAATDQDSGELRNLVAELEQYLSRVDIDNE